MAQLPEIWLEKTLRLLKLLLFLVLCEQHLHLFIAFHKVIRHDLNDAEDSSLVEIADEAFGLLGD